MKTKQTQALRDMAILTEDSYTGAGGFADGSYLNAYGREMNYEDRKSMSYYVNYIQPILDSQTDAVFNSEPLREIEGDEASGIVEGFIQDADNNGTSLTDVVKHATKYTNLLGNSFVIMDNFNEGDIPNNLQDVINERKYPFIYTKETYDVYEYETDIFGSLIDISFFYGMYTPEGSDKEVYLYKRFSQSEIEYFWVEEVINDDGTKEVNHRTVTLTKHELGVVPVVFYNSDILPVPPTYYSMATLAKAIYNTSSEIQDLQRSQSFSILLIPSTSTGEEGADNIVVSNHNALFYDADATSQPSYIAPDSNIMKTNQESLDKQINLLIQQADVLGSSAVSNASTASSGVAYAYKFYGKQQKLSLSSKVASYYDEGIIELLSKFIGVKINYEVKYTDTFAPTFAENKERITTLEQIANMDISDTVTSMVHADITKIIGGILDWDENELEGALDSITEVATVL